MVDRPGIGGQDFNITLNSQDFLNREIIRPSRIMQDEIGGWGYSNRTWNWNFQQTGTSTPILTGTGGDIHGNQGLYYQIQNRGNLVNYTRSSWGPKGTKHLSLFQRRMIEKSGLKARISLDEWGLDYANVTSSVLDYFYSTNNYPYTPITIMTGTGGLREFNNSINMYTQAGGNYGTHTTCTQSTTLL